MSRKSKEKRDKKKKVQLKAARKNSNVQADLAKLFDPSCLTTPAEINEDIRRFCKKISAHEPFFIDSEPEPWSRQSCCDQNVKEFIKTEGGSIVCGYKIWYNKPNYIEAERHAIWKGNSGYRDVSFNSDGEPNILFLPDEEDRQDSLEENVNKIRWGNDSKTKRLIDRQNQNEAINPIRKMSDQKAWDTMLSYENWCKGHRMSNVVQEAIS